MTTRSIRANRAGLGVSITVIGGLCFAIQDAGIKWLTAEVAVLQVLFLRSLFGIVFLSASTLFSGEHISLRVNRPWLLAIRTAINILCWVLFFYGLKYLPLATAVALFFSFPLAFIYFEAGRAGVNAYMKMIAKAREWLGKPMFVVIESFNSTELMVVSREATENLTALQIPVFPDFEVAARVMMNLKGYDDFLSRS